MKPLPKKRPNAFAITADTGLLLGKRLGVDGGKEDFAAQHSIASLGRCATVHLGWLHEPIGVCSYLFFSGHCSSGVALGPVTTRGCYLMKILVIANSFPPLLDSEAICSGKFVLSLLQEGHQITVIAQGIPQHERKVDSSKLWQKIDDSSVIWIGPPNRKLYRRFSSFLNKCYLLLPAASWWAKKAMDKGMNLCKREHFDMIISRGTSIECLYIGYKIAGNSGGKLISMLNDPPFFCFPPPYTNRKKNFFAKKVDLYNLKKIFNSSYLVAFPSARLLAYMERVLNTKFRHNAFISPHIGFYHETNSVKSETLSIVHAGKINWGRSSLPFLLALGKVLNSQPDMIQHLKVHFFGVIDKPTDELLQELGLSDVVVFNGIVSYEESLRIISKATALLLIEAVMEEGIFLPSKFCDYAITKKPLLLFSPLNGTVADMVGKYHPGLLGQNEEEVAQELTRFFTSWKAKKSLEDYTYPQAENFSSKRVIGDLLNKLRGMAQELVSCPDRSQSPSKL